MSQPVVLFKFDSLSTEEWYLPFIGYQLFLDNRFNLKNVEFSKQMQASSKQLPVQLIFN